MTPQINPRDAGTRWIPVVNSTAEVIPAFGLMRVTDTDDDGRAVVARPNADGQTDVLVNGPTPIAANGYGQGHRESPCAVAYDTGDGTPVNGDDWGAGSGSWKLRKNKTGADPSGAAGSGVVNVTHGFGSPTSGGLAVEEADGSPAYTGITKIIVDQSDGFVLSQPAANQARLDLAAATASQVGVVTAAAQTFGGAKTFSANFITVQSAAGVPQVRLDNAGLGTVADFTWDTLDAHAKITSYNTAGNTQLQLGLDPNGAYLMRLEALAGGGSAASWPAVALYKEGDASPNRTGASGTDALGNVFTGGFCTTVGGGGVGSGTVTSVNLTAPAAGITVSGGPITTSGSITLALANDLAALEALSGTNNIYYRSAANTWSSVTIGAGLSFAAGTLSSTVSGTVTSVAMTVPSILSVSGTPITTSGTLAVTLASVGTANLAFCSPNGSAGTPSFRALVSADLPLSAKADMESASGATNVVTPSVVQYHPGVAKGWVRFDGTAGTISAAASHNVSSLTDNGTGDYTVNWDTDFSSANYAVAAQGARWCTVNSYAAGTTRFQTFDYPTTTLADDPRVNVVAYGDQ